MSPDRATDSNGTPTSPAPAASAPVNHRAPAMRPLPQPIVNHLRRGTGKPLVLIHGLGGSLRTWDPILEQLAAEREVIVVELPGFGDTPPLPGRPTIAALTDALADFLAAQNLEGVDVVGSSMGARLVLELAARGKVGATVALDPGGFWEPGQLRFFNLSVAASVRLVKALAPLLPLLTGNPITRTLLLIQFSARPWALSAETTRTELESFASSSAILETLHELVHGPTQEGVQAGFLSHPVAIGWGRKDRVTLPSQAKVALERFPGASLHWFDRSGHFPHWDAPDETVQLILETTR